ncbi:hypothetical protein DL96DRAFT_96899 [Flagelloscypha sp. PMI_526]|nr:hypothetical protein DL96DRAFT_96899 [Flagelloscypha sp. PMI_526]
MASNIHVSAPSKPSLQDIVSPVTSPSCIESPASFDSDCEASTQPGVCNGELSEENDCSGSSFSASSSVDSPFAPMNSSAYGSSLTPSKCTTLDLYPAISGPVHKYGHGPVVRVPYAYENFDDHSTTHGVPFVDKTPSLDALTSVLGFGKMVFFRRPPSFGLTHFLFMIYAYLDASYEPTQDPFPSLAYSRWSLHSSLIFCLDMAKVQGPDVGQSLLHHVKACAAQFFYRYDILPSDVPLFEKEDRPEWIIPYLALQLIYGPFRRKGQRPMFVIVENYERADHTTSLPTAPEAMHRFFRNLSRAVDDRNVYGVLLVSTMDATEADSHILPATGVLPTQRIESLVFVDQRAILDITHHPAFQSAVGFTRREIQALDDSTRNLHAPFSRPLLELVDEAGLSSYVFTRDPRNLDQSLLFIEGKLDNAPVYPADPILDLLGQKCGMPNRSVSPPPLPLVFNGSGDNLDKTPKAP